MSLTVDEILCILGQDFDPWSDLPLTAKPHQRAKSVHLKEGEGFVRGEDGEGEEGEEQERKGGKEREERRERRKEGQEGVKEEGEEERRKRKEQ